MLANSPPRGARSRFIALALLVAAAPAYAADWTTPGGNAGMTKYSADDIPSTVAPSYVKRFYSILSNDPNKSYYYSQSVLIKDGTAAIFSYDAPPFVSSDNFGQGHQLTFIDYGTGTKTGFTITPSVSQWSSLPLPAGISYTHVTGRYSFHLGENTAEIDSGHFTQALVWGDDGNLYARHGGDDAVTAAFNPQTNAWTRLVPLKASPSFPNYNNFYEGDANGFLQIYGSQLLYRPGDTRQTTPYLAVDVSAAAFASGSPGNWTHDLGPVIPTSGAGDFYNGLRYGDIPKATTVLLNGSPTPVSIVSGLVTSSSFQFQVQTQATNLDTGAVLWTKNFATNSGGAIGFYTSTADFWRFIATDDGAYVMYDGLTGARTLRALDIASGNQRWSMPLPAGSTDPLLASHDNSLFVVAKNQQMKIDLDTGHVDWTANHAFQTEAGYTIGSDPLVRPMVLTDSTLWFVDGSNGLANQFLYGLSTTDGSIVQQIDLTSLVAQHPGESLLAVNDLVESDGRLGVLLAIRSSADTSGSTNSVIYQDLYTFTAAVPEPTTAATLGVPMLLLLLRRRR
jgi:hypothetical protein